jgi:hypothetical protein
MPKVCFMFTGRHCETQHNSSALLKIEIKVPNANEKCPQTKSAEQYTQL